MDINQVTVRRLDKIYISKKDESNTPLPDDVFVSWVGNLASLGYGITDLTYNALRNVKMETLNEIFESLKEIKAVPNYKPMYPNFPKQVADASEVELLLNALVHYTGDMIGVRIMPVYPEEIRKKLPKNERKITILGYAVEADLYELSKKILTQGDVYTEQDWNDLNELSKVIDFSTISNVNIPIKGNLVKVAIAYPDLNISLTSVTDVLRLAVGFSEGDISLATNTKFKLSRSERRRILAELEKLAAGNNKSNELFLGDFLRYKEQWKKLTYALHPSDYKNTYPHAVEALNEFVKKGRTLNSLVENADSLDSQLLILETVPGVFARKLNELLQKNPSNIDEILLSFKNVVKNVPIKTLVQLWNYFNSPNDKIMDKRLIVLNNGKSRLLDNTLSLDECTSNKVISIIEYGLENRLGKNIFFTNIDEADTVAVPLNTRNFNDSMKVLGRGSRLPIGDSGTIRLFTYWKDFENYDDYLNRVDIDLSAYLVNEDFSKFETISYYNLRENFAYHSGDITSAPNGAAEFVDVNIDKALDSGYRYVLATIFNYTRQPLNIVPELTVGYMERNKVNDGEIFEPATVVNKFTVNSANSNFTPILFDLKTREFIWIDVSLQPNASRVYNVASNENSFNILLNSILSSEFMTVGTLAGLIGNVVKVEDDADIVINSTKIVDVLNLIS